MNNISSKIADARKQLIAWGRQFEVCLLLDSHMLSKNPAPTAFEQYRLVLAAGCESELSVSDHPFDELKAFAANRYAFGFLGYDLKNYTERLTSSNFDGLGFPDLHFFVPQHIVAVNRDGEYEVLKSSISPASAIDEIRGSTLPLQQHDIISIKSRISHDEYIDTVKEVKRHIYRGDIYEMNFCQEFYAEDTSIDPASVYLELSSASPTPFACFYKNRNHYLLSASPERFMLKHGSKIISQPIKGTIKRGRTPEEDERLKTELRNNPKEQSENVMIVDLVRNDLSRTAKDGTVKVSELFGIYPFRQVFQMISTVESEVRDDVSGVDVVRDAYPMGSMTGAPKVRAMQLIEDLESTKRGLYSGSVGYFTPEGDFDLNVVIRSILYNASNRYLSFSVGGAITANSDPESEYNECMVKAKAIMEVLGQKSRQHND